MRTRASDLSPANDDTTGLDLSVDSKVFPEVDIGCFFTPNLAAELVLTYPQKHDARAGGARLKYTRFSSVELPAGVTIDKNRYGLAAGAGIDVPMGGGWLFNADVKCVQIRTEVPAGGASLRDFKVDPVRLSLRIGRRF